MWTFIQGLRSWQLFVLAALVLAADLVVPDPVPFVDEILLGVLTVLLARWRRPLTWRLVAPPVRHAVPLRVARLALGLGNADTSDKGAAACAERSVTIGRMMGLD